jgi:hypothetical protein
VYQHLQARTGVVVRRRKSPRRVVNGDNLDKTEGELLKIEGANGEGDRLASERRRR